ncbi:MAG: hypothetical protein ABEI52_04885, partial [Halobacteriaceae archaeon]
MVRLRAPGGGTGETDTAPGDTSGGDGQSGTEKIVNAVNQTDRKVTGRSTPSMTPGAGATKPSDTSGGGGASGQPDT